MRLSSFLDKYRKMFMSFATTEVVRAHSKKVRCAIREEVLRQNILNSTAPGVTDHEYEPGRQLIVSLTTFGSRIDWCGPAIESIMEQTVKPNRIVLWLGHEFEKPHMIPADLRMLEKRGLEIRFTDDIGPATKLVPSLKAFPEDYIITVDDDTIYNYNVIDKLIRGHYRYPDAIICDWQTSIHMRPDGSVYYTETDAYVQPKEPSMLPVAIGGAGVLYPPHSLHEDVFDIDSFNQLAPKADDLWFKIMGLKAGTKVFCMGDVCPTDERIFGMDHHNPAFSLCTYNLKNGGNDVQLAALFAKYPEAFEVYK